VLVQVELGSVGVDQVAVVGVCVSPTCPQHALHNSPFCRGSELSIERQLQRVPVALDRPGEAVPEEVLTAGEVAHVVEPNPNQDDSLPRRVARTRRWLQSSPFHGGRWSNVPYRQARLGENEALFRDVNETVATAAASDTGLIQFLCECGQEWCAEPVALTRSEYEHVRAVPERFFVRPGHNRPEIERVVERHPGYWVVEKFGDAGEVARETDRRSHNGHTHGA
jgi:hypothetical protein